MTPRASSGRSWLIKATLALGVLIAVAAGTIVVLGGGGRPVPSSHSAAAALRSDPKAGSPKSRTEAAEKESRGVPQPSACVVTLTNATVCGSAAAKYCNLVISRALPQGPAATRSCVSQIRQFNRERSRAYELDEESSEPMHASAGTD